MYLRLIVADEVVDVKKLKKKQKQDLLADDEGGPKRQFMDEFMRQMCDLVVHDEVKMKDVKLFQAYEVCFNPMTDERLPEGGELKKKAAGFYEAIGRLFALCFLHKVEDEERKERNIPIAEKCLPTFFRNCKSGVCSGRSNLNSPSHSIFFAMQTYSET